MSTSNSTFVWAHRNFSPWVKPSLRISEARRHLPFHWDREAAANDERERVYVGLLCDPFDPSAPDQWRNELCDTVEATPHLDWMLVTAHLEKACEFLTDRYANAGAATAGLISNLIVGAYVHNQEEAEVRIPALAKVPAVGHSVHCEPLRGPLDLSSINPDGMAALDWIICGVNEALTAHPFSKDWAMELEAQCCLHGIGFYSRQLSGRAVTLGAAAIGGGLITREKAEVAL